MSYDYMIIHYKVLVLISLISIIAFASTLLLLPFWVVRLKEDFFVQKEKNRLNRFPPLVRCSIVLAKNTLGSLLLLAGLVMLFIPGQGLLTMIMGLCLVNFPCKHRLKTRLLRLGSVQYALNWIRRKQGLKELKFP